MKKINKKDNLLDYKPLKNPNIQWRTLPNKHIQLDLVNKGFFHFLTQKLMKKPKVSKIELEEIGSFIWMNIDGKKTVYELSEEMDKVFGEKVQPTLNRLTEYLKVLYSNDFILYQK